MDMQALECPFTHAHPHTHTHLQNTHSLTVGAKYLRTLVQQWQFCAGKMAHTTKQYKIVINIHSHTHTHTHTRTPPTHNQLYIAL